MDVKPGFRTSEFWLTLGAYVVAAALLIMEATELVHTGGYAVLGVVAAGLASMGYSAARAKTKSQ